MKITLTLVTALMLILGTSVRGLHAQSTVFTTTDPVEYSNFVVKEQERIANEFLAFSNLLLSGADTKTCEARRQEVVRQIELAMRRLRNMAPFKERSGLRDEAVAVFGLYRDVHAGEFAKIAAIVANQTSTIAQMEEYFGLQMTAEKKMRDYTNRLLAAQRAFAKENMLTLLANPMQEQFDRILDGNIYNREVTLAYLAVAKPNEAWWDAMQKNDIAAMAQARADIHAAFSACKLSGMPGFLGSTEFRDVAQRMVLYYNEHAKVEYLDIEQVLGSGKAGASDIARVNAIIDQYNQQNQEQNEGFNAASLALMRKTMEK